MILVFVLLYFCNFLPVSTIYLGNRFPEAYEFLGAKNLSKINEERSEAESGLNADHVQEAVVPSEDPVIIQTLPVGQGDATIIVCPQALTGHKWFSLIDMGSTKQDKAMTREHYLSYINLLIVHGYKLKHIFLTHPDKDHLNYGYEKGSGQYLLPLLIANYLPENEKVTIHRSSRSSWESLPGKTVFLKNFLDYLNENYDHFNWNQYDPNGENVIDICGTSNEEKVTPSQVTMKIIAADLGTTTKPNKMSMVMSLNYQGQSENPGRKMLFMGDFEGITQYKLLLENEKYSQFLPADVVMVPHHGSDTEGNGEQKLYDTVKAKHAIISSHILASYYLPKLNTLESICDRYDITEEELPYDTCNAWEQCNPNSNMKEMAQGYETMYNFGYQVSRIQYPIGKGMVHFYEDSQSRGCMTKIHQTTKIGTEDGLMKAFIVETRLYPNKDPDVVSQPWHH